MKDLLQMFRSYEGDLRDLIPVAPKHQTAKTSYEQLVKRIGTYLSGEVPENLTYYRAKLVLNWIQGRPLAVIIASSERYWKRRTDKKKTLEQVIRESLDDVEQFVRFTFAKYSSCYVDVLRYFFTTADRSDLIELIPKLHIWLEFGASTDTQLAFMALGLSRSTAIELGSMASDESLSLNDARIWLKAFRADDSDLPAAVVTEVKKLQERL